MAGRKQGENAGRSLAVEPPSRADSAGAASRAERREEVGGASRAGNAGEAGLGHEAKRRPVRASSAGGRRLGSTRAAAAFDRAGLIRALDDGLTGLGLSIPAFQREQLIDYLALLSRWNAVYNLTAVRDPDAMLVHHLLDSLAIVQPLAARGPFGSVVDVGSGGGLPGVVLAIVWPEAFVHLVEPVGKKAAFLRQCASELALTGLRVHATKIESLAGRREFEADLIVCRAFASLRDFVAGLGGLVGPATIVAAMKGRLPNDEIASLPDDWRVQQVLPLDVPRLGAERHLLLLERVDGRGETRSPPCDRNSASTH